MFNQSAGRARDARPGLPRRRIWPRHAREGGITPNCGFAALSQIGLEPHSITAELTLADAVPQMAELKSLGAESLRRADQAIDGMWSPVAA
jgi:hypothetical protein